MRNLPYLCANFFCTQYLVHNAIAKLADFGHRSYSLSDLYNNVPYKNDTTVDYCLIIYILIIIYLLPVQRRIFFGKFRGIFKKN